MSDYNYAWIGIIQNITCAIKYLFAASSDRSMHDRDAPDSLSFHLDSVETFIDLAWATGTRGFVTAMMAVGSKRLLRSEDDEGEYGTGQSDGKLLPTVEGSFFFGLTFGFPQSVERFRGSMVRLFPVKWQRTSCANFVSKAHQLCVDTFFPDLVKEGQSD